MTFTNKPKRLMRTCAVALLCAMLGTLAQADHISVKSSYNPFEKYQIDASKKRYADIIKIAQLLEEHMEATGSLPFMNETPSDTPLYEVVPLGQKGTLAQIKENGTPFGFPLHRFDPVQLISKLEKGLERDISLPIDPQKVGTDFAPAYFVFLKRKSGSTPQHFTVLGTFAHEVRASTNVAKGVHIVGISSHPDIRFIVPLTELKAFDAPTISHILSEGQTAEKKFSHNVPLSVQ